MDDSDSMPISSRPVEGFEWSAGGTPWLRALQSATFGEPGVGYAVCLFCGAPALKLSMSDVDVDHGRLTVYCDNSNCDAREIEVLVTRDGGNALRRCDVRALTAIDAGSPNVLPRIPGRLVPVDAGAPSPDVGRIASRRMSTESHEMSF